MARIPTAEITVNGRRKIVNADDPRAQVQHGEETLRQEGRAQEMTRDDIASMSGPDLSDLLDMHGVETIPRALADRRALLSRIMFVET